MANAVDANLRALEADLPAGTVVNVGTGESITLNELYAAMAKILDSDLSPDYGPTRAGDARHSRAGLERARALLGYEPHVDWRTGLETTLAWYRERVGAGL